MSLRKLLPLAMIVAFVVPALRASEDDLRKELDRLKKDLDATKGELESVKKKSSDKSAPIASASAKIEGKYGPNASVTTKAGKLSISGLLQVWYYSIQNDNIGFYGDATPGVAGGGDTNEAKDNDSFSIRRAEIKFTMDIHENVTGVVMIDPARPLAGRPSFPTNVGIFSRTGVTSTYSAAVKSGDDSSGFKMFQDAYINYHGVVPHHDFQIGQYKPYLGEEGIRSSAALDFVERSMVGQLGDKRDLGLTAHGTWWDDRFQYWLGVFNGASDYFNSRGDFQNRVDDNDDKDFAFRVLVRPLWKNETWGSLEIGGSGQMGMKGESGGIKGPGGPTLDGLNVQRTWASKYQAWIDYRPGGPVVGWWIKGEYAIIKDRPAPGTVATWGATGYANGGTNAADYRNPVSVEGFYIATGYKISDSAFKDSAPGWLKNFEFVLRYEQFENILVGDIVDPLRRTDVFATDVWTGGFNYYIKGNNAKIQVNYMVVDSPDADSASLRGRTAATAPRHFRGVDNNSLVVNFQVAW